MEVHLYPAAGRPDPPTVIFFHDGIGLRPVMHEMAERLAAMGYLVAMPNMFYRAGDFPPFDPATAFTDPAERARLWEIIRQAAPASVMRDLGLLLEALADQPGARVDRVGCVGYCLGGRMAFTAAGAYPDRVAAAASIHGGSIATDEPDSPHRQADRIRGRLYFAVADNDRTCTPESQELLAATLKEAGVAYELELYSGAAHGFAVPDLATYDQAAAERHWQRLESLFAETLPGA